MDGPVALGAHWSATTDTGGVDYVWVADFRNSNAFADPKTLEYYVRAARTG